MAWRRGRFATIESWASRTLPELWGGTKTAVCGDATAHRTVIPGICDRRFAQSERAERNRRKNRRFGGFGDSTHFSCLHRTPIDGRARCSPAILNLGVSMMLASVLPEALARFLDARGCAERYGFSWRHWLRLVDAGRAPQP